MLYYYECSYPPLFTILIHKLLNLIQLREFSGERKGYFFNKISILINMNGTILVNDTVFRLEPEPIPFDSTHKITPTKNLTTELFSLN